eukprot:jgi/Psemu1/34101/gm1.34101_g
MKLAKKIKKLIGDKAHVGNCGNEDEFDLEEGCRNSNSSGEDDNLVDISDNNSSSSNNNIPPLHQPTQPTQPTQAKLNVPVAVPIEREDYQIQRECDGEDRERNQEDRAEHVRTSMPTLVNIATLFADQLIVRSRLHLKGVSNVSDRQRPTSACTSTGDNTDRYQREDSQFLMPKAADAANASPSNNKEADTNKAESKKLSKELVVDATAVENGLIITRQEEVHKGGPAKLTMGYPWRSPISLAPIYHLHLPHPLAETRSKQKVNNTSAAEHTRLIPVASTEVCKGEKNTKRLLFTYEDTCKRSPSTGLLQNSENHNYSFLTKAKANNLPITSLRIPTTYSENNTMAPPTRAQLAAIAAVAAAEAASAERAATEAGGILEGLLVPPSITTRLDPEQLEQLTRSLVARLLNRNLSLSLAAKEAKERADANLGIPGYAGERALTAAEVCFRKILESFGVNRPTANEIFRHGYSNTKAIADLNSEGTKCFLGLLSKEKHHLCLDPQEVFIGRAFGDRLKLFVAWIRFQPIIGATATEVDWIKDPTAETDTRERLRLLFSF